MVKNKKAVPKAEPPSNGYLEALADAMAEMTRVMGQMKQDFQDQLDDIRRKKDDNWDEGKVIAARNAYEPPRYRLSEYSIISNSSIKPFALATVCGSCLDPAVLRGELSLCDVFMDETKRLLRGKGGKLLGYAAEQAKEEAQKSAENIDAEDARVHGI